MAITSCWRSQSASVVSSSDFDSDSPALLTTRSRPPKASTAASTIAWTAASSDTSAATPTATSGPPISAAAACGLGQVEVGDRRRRRPRRRAAWRWPCRCRDGGAGDERDPGGERLGLRHPLELGLLERPVLDAELLRLVDRGVGREALGAAHHVDRVDVELAGHAGGLLVLAVARTCRRPGTRMISGSAPRIAGLPRRRVAVVVGRRSRRGRPRAARASAGLDLLERARRPAGRATIGLTLVRRKWSGQRRAERGQARVVAAGQEVEHDLVVGEVADHRPVRATRRRAASAPSAAARARRSAGAQRLALLQRGRRTGSAWRARLDVAPRRCG